MASSRIISTIAGTQLRVRPSQADSDTHTLFDIYLIARCSQTPGAKPLPLSEPILAGTLATRILPSGRSATFVRLSIGKTWAQMPSVSAGARFFGHLAETGLL